MIFHKLVKVVIQKELGVTDPDYTVELTPFISKVVGRRSSKLFENLASSLRTGLKNRGRHAI